MRYDSTGTRTRYIDSTLSIEPMVFQLADAKNCVAFLFGSKPTSKGEPEPVGTCFFVEFSEASGHSNLRYLVTAKHVLIDLQKLGKAVVRLNNPNGGVSYLPVPLEEGEWLLSSDEAIDVAVLPLPWVLGEADYELAFDNLDAPLNGDPWPWPIREGEDVAFTGLVFNFLGKSKNLLALRVGTMALVPDEPIQGLYGGPSQYYVIDVQAYPGNSGAPVWFVSGLSCFLLGVLSAGYPTKAQLHQLATSTFRKEEYYNLGMALVTPIEKVLAIIKPHLERENEMNKKKVAPAPLSPPTPFTRDDMESALRKVSRKVKPSTPDQSSKRT
ncbi:MAG TPA: hypothetical protein VMR52_10965 [Dehalococcoidia bacterium]|nr:hypothetical protein [Dehalococcoidia bacterium]